MKLLNKDEFLANELKFYFMQENLKEGDKLPSERELAEEYGVQRVTVRSAYQISEEEGIVENRNRSGHYMGHGRIRTDLCQIQSFREKAKSLGMDSENKLLAFELVEVDKDLSKKIKLPIGTVLNKITRIRKVRREEEMFPVAIEYAYIPEAMAEKLMKYDLEERSLFQILSQEYGRVPKREEQVVEIVYADEFEARTLQVDQRTTLVMKEGITYDDKGNILQFLHTVMKKDWVVFEQGNDRIRQKMEEVAHGL